MLVYCWIRFLHAGMKLEKFLSEGAKKILTEKKKVGVGVEEEK